MVPSSCSCSAVGTEIWSATRARNSKNSTKLAAHSVSLPAPSRCTFRSSSRSMRECTNAIFASRICSPICSNRWMGGWIDGSFVAAAASQCVSAQIPLGQRRSQQVLVGGPELVLSGILRHAVAAPYFVLSLFDSNTAESCCVLPSGWSGLATVSETQALKKLGWAMPRERESIHPFQKLPCERKSMPSSAVQTGPLSRSKPRQKGAGLVRQCGYWGKGLVGWASCLLVPQLAVGEQLQCIRHGEL